jgi:hypothetical protein
MPVSERDDLIKSLTEEFVSRSLQGETLPEVCGFIADAILLVRGLNDRLRAELAAAHASNAAPPHGRE